MAGLGDILRQLRGQQQELGLAEMRLDSRIANLLATYYPEPVFVIEAEHDRIEWASPGALLWTGRRGKELKKLSASQLIKDYFIPSEPLLELLRKRSADGRYTGQFRALPEAKYIEAVWMRIPGENGLPDYFLLLLNDTTELELMKQELIQYSEELKQQIDTIQQLTDEKEKAYQRLREQSEKLRLISTATAYSNTMKFILTPDGTIVWVNRFFEKASGWSAAELIGRNVREIGGSFGHLLPSPEAQPTEETLIVNHLHRVPFTEEIFAYDRQGRGYWMLITVAPVPNEFGETTHYLGALINIHERKERERELKAYKEEIEESLSYAMRIQKRFLSSVEILRQYFSAAEVWYEPLMGIGGDFYQFEPVEGGLLIAMGDCTGHGIGASMLSVYAATSLRFAIQQYLNDIEAIYQQLLRDISGVFGGNNPLYEGFELALLRYVPSLKKLAYIGAGRPLWVMRQGQIFPLTGSRGDISITTSGTANKSAFLQQISLQSGDRLYLFTDGLTDQLNAEGKRFSRSRLQSFLTTNSYLPLSEQIHLLREAIQMWRINASQTDDILLIAMQV